MSGVGSGTPMVFWLQKTPVIKNVPIYKVLFVRVKH